MHNKIRGETIKIHVINCFTGNSDWEWNGVIGFAPCHEPHMNLKIFESFPCVVKIYAGMWKCSEVLNTFLKVLNVCYIFYTNNSRNDSQNIVPTINFIFIVSGRKFADSWANISLGKWHLLHALKSWLSSCTI